VGVCLPYTVAVATDCAVLPRGAFAPCHAPLLNRVPWAIKEWPMISTTTLVVSVCLTALSGLLLGYVAARAQDRHNLHSANAKAAEIVDQAQKSAENFRKDAELKSKDEFFQKREEFNREVEKSKNELREQERRLEKREDSLEQKHQLQMKKERALEHTQK